MLGLYDLTKEEEKVANKIFKTVCKLHGIKARDISAEITMVSAQEIHELNLSTRQVDKPTDVLSYLCMWRTAAYSAKHYLLQGKCIGCTEK